MTLTERLILHVNWTALMGQEVMDKIEEKTLKLKEKIKKRCGSCKVKMPGLEGNIIELEYPGLPHYKDIKGLQHDNFGM